MKLLILQLRYKSTCIIHESFKIKLPLSKNEKCYMIELICLHQIFENNEIYICIAF